MKGDVAAYRVVYLLQSPLGQVVNVTAFGYVTKLLQPTAKRGRRKIAVARILFVERRLGPFPYLVIGCEGVESRRLSVWPLAREAARSRPLARMRPS